MMQRKIKPVTVMFWKRFYGSLWIPFERERVLEFGKVRSIRSGESVRVSGYVKWIDEQRFLLLPTPFSNQVYLICVNLSEKRPKENSYVEVEGKVTWDCLKRIGVSLNMWKGEKVIQVHDWKDEKVEIPFSEVSFTDFKEDLTYRIEGLEPFMSDFLAFVAISSPRFFGNIGGISLTLYDSTEQGLSRLIVRELRRIIPSDIHKPYIMETPFGKMQLRYKFAHFSADTEKTKKVESLLSMRLQLLSPFDEVSLSLYSEKKKPKTILDPPCSLSDIPTVVPEDVAVNRSKSADFSFNAFEYMVTQHLRMPIVESYEEALISIISRLEKLREDYDIDPVHLTRYGFLNANYYARPVSILRIALAYARANFSNIVNKELVDRVFEEYFKQNFEYVYEVWEDAIKKPGIPIIIRAEYRDIVRVMRKYEDKHGVSIRTIVSELKEDPLIVERKLKEMANYGIIYETLKGYKLTPIL